MTITLDTTLQPLGRHIARMLLNGAAAQLNVQVKPVDAVVDGGEQKQQLINVECISDFSEAPILTVQFV